MRYLLLLILVPAALVEYSSHGQVGLALLSTFYVFLMAQADHAAKRFLRDGLYPVRVFSHEPQAPRYAREEIKIEDVLDAPPLGTKKERSNGSYYSRKNEEKAEPKQAASPQAKPQPAAAKPQPKKEIPKEPIFNGKPHEVLAVQVNAGTQTIVRAFRHWVKQYHPDHARTAAEAESANEHTRCLSEAKQKLLNRRKEMRKPRSA